MNPANMPEYYKVYIEAATTGTEILPASESYQYAIDHIHAKIDGMTSGYLRVGGGPGGVTKPAYFTEATGDYDDQMDGDGYRLATNQALGFAVSGTGVKIQLTVGYHKIKVA